MSAFAQTTSAKWLALVFTLIAFPVVAQSPALPTLDGNRLVVGPVDFVRNSATPLPVATVPLARVKTYLEAKTYVTALRIEGHATGSRAQPLSEARAMAVARALVAMGVDCHRLVVTGFGATKPVAEPNSAANSRIEFVNVALRGRLIGGLPADGGGMIAGDACK